MDWQAIIEAGKNVLSVLLILGGIAAGFGVVYYKASARLQTKAAELIAVAEGMYTEFDWVQVFAVKQLDKITK